MCGISGFLSKKYSFEQLQSMNRAIQHRGPDAEGYYHEDSSGIGLGHRRLSIIDLSEAANQPFYSQSGRYVMVFNGEVFNYQAVAKQYNVPTKTSSDTEVVLEMFVRKGPECVHDFNGMFAIAVWDKETRKLYLCRDRIGVKPLFYYHDGQNFAFASESKALKKLIPSLGLDEESIKDFLFLEYVPGERSAFKGVKRLAPGHWLEIDETGQIQVYPYYDLLEKSLGQATVSHAQAKAELKELLIDSIRLRNIADVPLGAFLSGGTDSSLISALYQHVSDKPLKAYTIGFNVGSHDESGYATQVAKALNLEHHLIPTNEQDAIGLLDKVIAHYDEPFAASSAFPSMLVCAKAREHITVALSGDGGDELFMGYGYYNWHDRVQRIHQFGGKPGTMLAAQVMKMLGNRGKRAASILEYPDFASAWIHVWSQEQQMFTEAEVSKLMGGTWRHSTLLPDWQRINAMDLKPWEKISLFDMRHYLADNLLYKMDIASMASALEVRVPLLDYRVVEKAISLPQDYRAQGPNRKILLKEILEDYLPKELIYRTKWGFPAPMGQWLLNDMAPVLEQSLDPQKIKQQGIFNPAEVQKLVAEFKGGATYLNKKVWALIFFQRWYEHHM